MQGTYLQIEKMQCLHIGSGEKVLFAFHGFGQTPNFVEVLAEKLPQYTIYSFDLLSFGKEPSKKEVLRLINSFCKQYKITEFAILAFSIGGKMALSFLENCHQNISKVCLIAPDGFKKHFFYEFAVSRFGKILFWKFIKNPLFFIKLAKRLLPSSFSKELKIIEKYTQTPPKRFLLWRTWLANRFLYPNHKKLHKIWEEQQYPTQIWLAENDLLAPIVAIHRFSKKHKSIHLKEIPTNHQKLLHEVFANREFLNFFKP
ncbi:MAG: alpha/beta fold hydrolase [Thermonemataceae bacterium]|nr:alpha/beta fold hydrolase [Thermonemataceae bacterium]